MGIYAVTPGKSEWGTTEPYFDKIKVNLEDKTTKVISKKMLVNELKYCGIKNNDLVVADGFSNPDILIVPVIQAESKSFKEAMKVTIISQNPKDVIYYDISEKNDYLAKKLPSVVYKEPFEILETSTISAYIKKDESQSNTISATFFKKPNNYTINIKSKYNPQYHAGGPEGLIDGIYGTENWRKGDWQGYQSQDFEAVIDLQSEKNVSNFSATFLQDSRSWILMPTKVDYYSSSDNINFTLIGTIENNLDPKFDENKIQNFEYKSPKEIKARYIKIKAYNFGKLPEWHQGFGGDAFIFIDEITIK